VTESCDKEEILLFSNMPPKKATTPIKYFEGSSLTYEECDLKFRLYLLQKKVNEMMVVQLKKVDFLGYREKNKRKMEKNMNANKKGI